MPLTITFTVTIPDEEVNEFVELICGGEDHAGDLLLRGFSGYWLCGIARYTRPDLRGWLVWDQCADEAEQQSTRDMDEGAADLLRGGCSLPPRYYFVDRATAIKILEAGVKRHGSDFYNGTCDYVGIDEVVQTVLLGEVTYG
jgi:hypothetical protein